MITNGETRLYVKSGGNVGIGTSGPGEKLEVNGNVKASKFVGELESDKVRKHISVTDNGGDGSLAYNSGTGVITYTGPSASQTRAHFSGGTGVSITNGTIAIGQSVSTSSNPVFNNLFIGNVGHSTIGQELLIIV